MSTTNHISQHISQLDAINSRIKESFSLIYSSNSGYHNRKILECFNPLNQHNIYLVSILNVSLCV